MASLTIRNIDDGIKRKLRVRAAESGHSMEEEARLALSRHVDDRRLLDEESAGQMFRRVRLAHGGGDDLDLPDRSGWVDRPVDFDA